MTRNISDDINLITRITAENKLDEPVRLEREPETGNLMLIYRQSNQIKVEFKYSQNMLWMTQAQISEIFNVDRSVITKHIRNIYDEGELAENATCAKIAHVQNEGERKVKRDIKTYDLNVIISVGYRVSSQQATLFRIWATDKIVQFATKGFVIDAARLKGGADHNHLKELRETIRDIRASEANLYREVRTICSMCQDYDASSAATRIMYATIQNKLLWASVNHTAPEIIVNRADAKVENMGLTNWPRENIRKSDTTIAHNYLGEAEVKTKNRLTNMLLDFFESRVEQGKLTTMAQAEAETNRFIQFNEFPLLTNKGSVKRSDADRYAHSQYKLFDTTRRALRHANP
jgi:hypothetical protein